MAMPMLMAIISIAFVMVASTVYVSNNMALFMSHTQAQEDAIHIAEAGYNKYLWCLNDNSYFYKTGINESIGFLLATIILLQTTLFGQEFPKNTTKSNTKTEML